MYVVICHECAPGYVYLCVRVMEEEEEEEGGVWKTSPAQSCLQSEPARLPKKTVVGRVC